MSLFHHHCHHSKPRVLFVLKRRDDFNDCPSYSSNIGLSTGLLNSASFVNEMLIDLGHVSNIAVVIDNNDIDREVTAFRPDIVIIEALWVVPEKFEVLTKLHPNVKWVIRYHSEAPFIAGEGIAMKWTLGYAKHQNVYLGINSPRFLKEIKVILAAAGYDDDQIKDKVAYLPNYYPVSRMVPPHFSRNHRNYVNVGCFGAIRPLKNHLVQAIAALKFAENIGQALHFHVNIGRTEMKGEPILNNLIELFAGLADNDHELIIHEWAPHEEFIKLIRGMDIGMQVSFTETFNIVAADMISAGVPVVLSDEIPWAIHGLANPTNSLEISEVMTSVWHSKTQNILENSWGLKSYVETTIDYWKEFLKG